MGTRLPTAEHPMLYPSAVRTSLHVPLSGTANVSVPPSPFGQRSASIPRKSYQVVSPWCLGDTIHPTNADCSTPAVAGSAPAADARTKEKPRRSPTHSASPFTLDRFEQWIRNPFLGLLRSAERALQVSHQRAAAGR